MPLIHFKCNVCDERFESFQRLRDGFGNGPPCPGCGSGETVVADSPLDDLPGTTEVGSGTVK